MILFMPKNLIPGLLLPLIGYLLFFLLSFYHVLSSLERTKAPGTSKNSHFVFCSQVASDIPRSHKICLKQLLVQISGAKELASHGKTATGYASLKQHLPYLRYLDGCLLCF